MPNMVGGSQSHPAYMPRRLEKHEVLVGSCLYTIDLGESVVLWEGVDGCCGEYGFDAEQLPVSVKRRITQLKSRIAEHILVVVDDLVMKFMYYDRKEDEDLPRGVIEEAVKSGAITPEQIVQKFSEALMPSFKKSED